MANMGYEIFKRYQRLQGGTEAVPSELPTPPDQPPDRGDRLRQYLFDQVRQGVLPDEALAEIKQNPTSLRSMLAYGEGALAAGTLLSGGEGVPRGEKLPKLPDVPVPKIHQKLYGERVETEWNEGHPNKGGDGHWIQLKPGWEVDDVTAIHEPTRAQALSRLREAKFKGLPVGGSDVIGNVPGATTQGDGGGTVAQEPPQQYVRGTTTVKGYGPTHAINT